MERFREILLQIWQEVCRHIDITQSTAAIAKLLVQRMPLGQLAVLSLDQEHRRVSTLALGFPGPPPFDDSSASVPWRLLAAWGSKDGLLSRAAEATPLSRFLFDGIGWCDALAGPLRGQQGTVGVLLLVAAEGQFFDALHHEMAALLLDAFSAALENDRRLREMAALREAAEADKRSLLTKLGRETLENDLIGSGLTGVMERLRQAAPSDAPVLLLGETGTGKELLARALHHGSPRAEGPIIRVNCGAIPPELVDSQLFGHVRGSFTGATSDHKGWFERAHGGTLFLDEVGELPVAAQVRLLRVLQDGWLEPVGSSKPLRVDVRVVAATHQDLAAMVSQGRFREDLWYRLAVFPILVPPLRERVQDIPLLARHFAIRAAHRYGFPEHLPTPEDLVLLARYPWPGNVRELISVLERAALIGNGIKLEVAKALGITTPLRAFHDPDHGARIENVPLAAFVSMDEAMRHHIEAALVLTQGKVEGKGGAAAILRINPHTLRARMRKLSIDWRKFRERAKLTIDEQPSGPRIVHQ